MVKNVIVFSLAAADHSPKTHSGGYSSTKVGLIVGLVITLLVFLILVLVGVVYIRFEFII